MTANSTEHLPDWPAQNVGKMLTAFCGCFWLTDQFFDLTGNSQDTFQLLLTPGDNGDGGFLEAQYFTRDANPRSSTQDSSSGLGLTISRDIFSCE